MPFHADLTLVETMIDPDWVDCHGNMNDAAYARVFSQARDAQPEWTGIDEAFSTENRFTIHPLELRIPCLHEA